MNDLADIENNPSTYLIFGATGGVGLPLARRLVSLGANVVLSGRNQGRLQAISAELKMDFLVGDVTASDVVERLVEEAKHRLGSISGIAFPVGSLLLKPAHLTSDRDWDSVLAVNLTAAFHLVRAAGKHMREGGSVVLFSSAAGRIGMANHEAIAAAKAGVIGLARSAAASYARIGLRFNVIAPGLLKTPLSESIWSNPISLQASLAMHPLGRLGAPEEVASLAAWLLDPYQSWVTGEVFSLDGGLSGLKVAPSIRA